jgi:1-acyl-sn-glycerol-3-phosphate acyltransferase
MKAADEPASPAAPGPGPSSLLLFYARVAGIAGGLLVCVPLFYLWRLFGSHVWSRLYLRWVAWIAGLRIRIVGAPLRKHSLFLANHTSWLDIMAVASGCGASFIAKDDVGRWPVVGWLARIHRTIFIARAARTEVQDQADAVRRALESGLPIALFPEGTTKGGIDLLPFRASLIAALYPPIPGLRVQPVALDYGAAGPEVAWVGEEGAAANARRVLSRVGTIPLILHFLPPIDPASVGDRKMLAALARERIMAALVSAASARTRDPGSAAIG